MKNKVAIYHMVLDPIRKGCIDIQLDTLKYYASQKNWEVVDIYLDNTNIESEKKELQRLLEDSQKGMFDIVLMKNAYYISRHTNKYLLVRKALKENNVFLHTLVEGDL